MKLLLLLIWHILTCLANNLDTNQQSTPQAPRYDLQIDKGHRGSYPVRKLATSKLKPPLTNFPTWSPECVFPQDDGAGNEFYFLTPKGWKVKDPGPMILDSNGEVVWMQHFGNEFGGQAYDLMVQEWKGEKVLTFWLGDDRVRGHGDGEFLMLNSSYDVVHKMGGANGRYADLHEFIITPQGTALIIIFEVIQFDVRPAGRKFNDLWNQVMWDCIFQEIDIATGKLIFEWRASKHLDIRSSYKKLIDLHDGTMEHPYDPHHLNSVEKDELGNYLVSARYTHAVYYISGETHEVIWTLGGKNNSFMDLSGGHALNFAWQHDARFAPASAFPESYAPPSPKKGTTTRLLTLFDNAAEDWNYDYGPAYARGLLLEITYPTPGLAAVKEKQAPTNPVPRSLAALELGTTLSTVDKAKIEAINGTDASYTVRVVQQFVNPKQVRCSSQGSLQILPSSNPARDSQILVGYGINAIASIFSSNGTLLCDLHFGAEISWEKGNVQSYRALRFSGWVGRPKQPPDVSVSGKRVFVSWNGATEVREWVLQVENAAAWDEGAREDDSVARQVWRDVARARKAGFEMGLVLPEEECGAKKMRVVALDKEGKICENGVSRELHSRYFGLRWVHEDGGWSTRLSSALPLVGCVAVLVVLARRFRRPLFSLLRGSGDGRWKLP